VEGLEARGSCSTSRKTGGMGYGNGLHDQAPLLHVLAVIAQRHGAFARGFFVAPWGKCYRFGASTISPLHGLQRLSVRLSLSTEALMYDKEFERGNRACEKPLYELKAATCGRACGPSSAPQRREVPLGHLQAVQLRHS
jgi:hypothetical protein